MGEDFMRLIKHGHACVEIEKGETRILIDPGTFTASSGELLARATVVLFTHDHFDHLNIEAAGEALRARPELRVVCPDSVAVALEDREEIPAERILRVSGGEFFDIDGVDVHVVGGDHAQIHDGIPVPHNVGFVVETIYHPGDSYRVPALPVRTLLVPVSGPWVKLGDAIDFVASVRPERSVLMHDIMLSDIGRASAAMFLGENGLTRTPATLLASGESIEA
jgi:L-ascorbate metabolism protein UlaG (beta-lactamase superfamily)